MEVTYQLEPEDISHLSRYILDYRSKITPTVLYACIYSGSFLSLVSAAMIYSRINPYNLFSLGLILEVLSVAILVYSYIIHPNKAVRELQQDSQVTSRKTMQISTNGVFVKHSLGELTLHWPLIVDIIDHQNCFYFFLKKNEAFPVPKRAFSNPESAQEFFQTSKQYWMTAKNIASPYQEADPATWPPPPQVGTPNE